LIKHESPKRVQRILEAMKYAHKTGKYQALFREVLSLGVRGVEAGVCLERDPTDPNRCVRYCVLQVTHPEGLLDNPAPPDCVNSVTCRGSQFEFKTLGGCISAYAKCLVKQEAATRDWSERELSAMAYNIAFTEVYALNGKCYGEVATAREVFAQLSDAISDLESDLDSIWRSVKAQIDAVAQTPYDQRWQEAVDRVMDLLKEYQRMLVDRLHPPACHTVATIYQFCQDALNSQQIKDLPDSFSWLENYIAEVQSQAAEICRGGNLGSCTECTFDLETGLPENFPCCDPEAVAEVITPITDVLAFG